MLDQKHNTKRIAKNTIALYFRMLLTMAVGLFTSRVILDSLGVEDYGIYNLVGGFVSMFHIVRAGLLTATQRFISYDLGKGNLNELKSTFSTCFIIFLMISLLIVVIAELFGVWFIETKLAIPQDRMSAAHWVFQLSLLTLVVTLLSYPYNALIIAHERMKAFAYISIYEAFAKLGIAYALYISSSDRLILYAILLCLVQISVRFIYNSYCLRNFKESKIEWVFNWIKMKKIYGFTGWEMFGSIASIGYTQGLNILLGLFFNPAVNAARGVALQVQHAIVGFVTNFQTAINPQITKSYASGDKTYMFKLINASSRFSFFLMLFFSLPLLLETSEVLNIWLIEVPEYTVVFFRLIIIISMIDAISNPIITSVEATGKIRNYQIVLGGILLLIVPIAYLFLKLGFAPYSVFVVHLCVASFVYLLRILMGSKIVGFNIREYIDKTFVPVVVVSITSVIIPSVIHFIMDESIARLLLVCIMTLFSVAVSVYCVGLQQGERQMVISKCRTLKNGRNK